MQILLVRQDLPELNLHDQVWLEVYSEIIHSISEELGHKGFQFSSEVRATCFNKKPPEWSLFPNALKTDQSHCELLSLQHAQ